VGLDHVSVTVLDLDRSLAFYHGLLGISTLGTGEEDGFPIREGSDTSRTRFRYADLDLGAGQILELIQYLHPLGTPLSQRVYDPGSGHLALRVSGLDELLARLSQAGYPARFEPVTLTEPAWWQGARVVYITDPDGVTVELVERTGPSHSAEQRPGLGK
jgi:catechol 2,3-dioxygenase-like lactoylglutathione lyase family enzyme